MKTLPNLLTAALLVALCACNKDELTVESTATVPVCEKVTVALDIDSLTHRPHGPGGSPDVRIHLCACDTLALVPVNIPPNYDFQHWMIDLGPENATFNGLVLDTITVSSELWIDFDANGPQDEHFRIQVDVAPCD
jgi:hypothetical protein